MTNTRPADWARSIGMGVADTFGETVWNADPPVWMVRADMIVLPDFQCNFPTNRLTSVPAVRHLEVTRSRPETQYRATHRGGGRGNVFRY